MSFSNLISSALSSELGDFTSAQTHAQNNHSSTDPSLFSSALSFLSERKSQIAEQSDDIDEEHLVQSHQALYNGGGSGGYGGEQQQQQQQQHDSSSLGAGAAMQALKMFSSGGGSGDKNEFIGMAMAQAGKLWEENAGGGNVSGSKQSAINSAAEMAFKMYLKGSGSSGTGGPAGLMSLASKFL
ncbi:hypothetical protein BO70DRAFT_359496 [Aspergillus heteromorphus CBS 117.55]|uniref:DUF7721 domain-containing protein n=1 Tax=Aspergillus heteromorphus CBS 117.55 TaxID=1448321 RepID=A0A317WS64_9EURO|nr:uncharacterized protein BO70DRAFT_359496 [Aspergillus heteromorphus CBS 117.55]PWY89209.1 hypothetical protein BO70DRAFT_359496 [Aspergillus heteromorphus CBS 117.55]